MSSQILPEAPSRRPSSLQSRKAAIENLVSMLENWSAKSDLEIPREMAEEEVHTEFEPIRLVRRVILRNQVVAPVEQLASFHKLMKDDVCIADSVVSAFAGGEYDPLNLFLYCYVRNRVEERQKITGQLSGLFVADEPFGKDAQDVFEQFYERHGRPNLDEKLLLRHISGAQIHVIDEWFSAKHMRMRFHTLLLRALTKIVRQKSNTPSA